MLYKAAFLYQSGGIECGVQFDACCDADAVALAQEMARKRHAQLFSLREQCGMESTRVVRYLFNDGFPPDGGDR